MARTLTFFNKGELDDAEQFTVENLKDLYGSMSVADDSVSNLPSSAITVSAARDQLSRAAQRDASGEVGNVVGCFEPRGSAA